MKLCYLKAKNILSFGQKEVNLNFSSFNIIAGPNNSGKTNVFRALKIIEQSFGYREINLAQIIHQNEIDRPFFLEVNVELDDSEVELLTTSILCFELRELLQPTEGIREIKENEFWKSILLEYGKAIISKSLKHLSFILSKNNLISTEPTIVAKLTDETESVFITRGGKLAGFNNEIRSYSSVSLGKYIVEDFMSRFNELEDGKISNFLSNINENSKDIPSLGSLLKQWIGNPNKVVSLSAGNFTDLRNSLSDEPILIKLHNLLKKNEIEQMNLYLWNVLKRIYERTFVHLHESRSLKSNFSHSQKNEELEKPSMLGSELALKLFWLMSSGTRKNREKYNKIKSFFKAFTNSEFDIAVRVKRITETSQGELGIMSEQSITSAYSGTTEFNPLGIGKEKTERLLNETYVQIIKNNYPIPIEQSASGFYEILFILTTIIGEENKILLMDEPELHLHPTMQKRILKLLESGDLGNNQIILITHSPYFVPSNSPEDIWRFTKTDVATTVHNLGSMILDLNSREQKMLSIKLTNPELCSLLFSCGVIFVEGLSDKIVIQEIDEYISKNKKKLTISENEWALVNIDGKKSLPMFIKLSKMLGIPFLSIMDYDALMHKEYSIKIDNKKINTSLIIFSLWEENKLEKTQDQIDLLSKSHKNNWYDGELLDELKQIAQAYGIFVFSSDLEGVIQSKKTTRTKKPLKALEKIIALIITKKIPKEFFEMKDFLELHMKLE